MFNFDAAFYRPLWIRLGIVILCLGWGVVEVLTHSPGFAILFFAVGGYAAYRFFMTSNSEEE
jgi:hypothetical protein